MTIEQYIEEIKQIPPLTGKEKRECYLKCQLYADQEGVKKAKKKLLQSYLSYTLIYLKQIYESFPETIKTEEDAFDVIQDGYLFLTVTLEKYLNSYTSNQSFKYYFQRNLTIMVKEKKKQYLKEKVFLESFESSRLDETLKLEDEEEFRILEKEINKSLENLSKEECYVIKNHYGLESCKPKMLTSITKELKTSYDSTCYLYELAMKKLKSDIQTEEHKRLFYKYSNSLKIIK